MLDICLLGTGGTLPLAKRWLTSLLLRYQGHYALIDCGEGTQIAAQKAGASLKPIDKIFLTHLHADHISGLPGLLLSMGNQGRTEPISIIGPTGTEQRVNCLCSIAPNLPFEISVSELDGEDETMTFFDCDVRAFRVQHSLRCYGYSFSLPRNGKFDAQKAREAGIPLELWKSLQRGENAETDGHRYTPDMVLGPPRKGLKICYCTDTRPLPRIAEEAAGADLFICEGMYGDAEALPKALENKHMLFCEAARLAAEAKVSELWLTHFSPSMPKPGLYIEEARAIFPNTLIPRDGWCKELHFPEE